MSGIAGSSGTPAAAGAHSVSGATGVGGSSAGSTSGVAGASVVSSTGAPSAAGSASDATTTPTDNGCSFAPSPASGAAWWALSLPLVALLGGRGRRRESERLKAGQV
ncbi:MAG TPA: hypothetical protein VFK05_31985 [Polyangiaceae bacterium]|nr:hypothetical protein [Polyangiaceae bacterium]